MCVIDYNEKEQKAKMKIVTEECHDAVINHESNKLKLDKDAYKSCVENQGKEIKLNSDKALDNPMSKSFLDRDYLA